MLAAIAFLLIFTAFLCFCVATVARWTPRVNLIAVGLALCTLAVLLAAIAGDVAVKGLDF